MNQEIEEQYKICWKLSDELDFAASYYPTEITPFAAHHELIKNKLRSFVDVCIDSDDDLIIITRIRIETEYLTKQMRSELLSENRTINDPAKQQNIIATFVNLSSQIDDLMEADKIKFKIPIKIANVLVQKITMCQNENEALQHRLSCLEEQDLKIAHGFIPMYLFHSSKASRQKDLESQLNKNKLQLATHTHKLMVQLLNIFRIQQANNLDLHANNSVAKFRTNSQVLAFADGSKRRPAFTSSALGFVNA